MTIETAHQLRCPSCDYWYAVDEWDVDETPLYFFGKAEPERIIRTATCPGCKALHDEEDLEWRGA